MSNPFAHQEQQALATLGGYLDALNARDSQAMRAHFHFPHYRMAGTVMTVYESAQDYGIDNFLNRADTPGWAYTRWDRRQVIHSGAVKVHLDVQFTRYRDDDSVLGTYQSLWVVILRDKKWGIVSRSSYAA